MKTATRRQFARVTHGAIAPFDLKKQATEDNETLDAHAVIVSSPWPAMLELAKQFRKIQQARISLDLQRQAYDRSNLGGPGGILFLASTAQTAAFEKGEQEISKMIVALGRDTELAKWIKDTKGLGPSVYLCAALMSHPPGEYRTVSGMWKGAGWHPHGKPQRGVKLDYAPWRQGMWYRLVQGLMAKTSAYRHYYDERRAHTTTTHPECPHKGCETCGLAKRETKEARSVRAITRERAAIGKDCANMGGPHWSKGHRHNDAVRFMLKAAIRDLWRVTHDLKPLL